MPAFKCARCQQPLPEGSGYCVACGTSNDLDRLGQAHLTLHGREKRVTVWRRIATLLTFLRFMR